VSLRADLPGVQMLVAFPTNPGSLISRFSYLILRNLGLKNLDVLASAAGNLPRTEQ
jgi:hypothetical protein